VSKKKKKNEALIGVVMLVMLVAILIASPFYFHQYKGVRLSCKTGKFLKFGSFRGGSDVYILFS
jgi:hypothetical protein